MKETYSDEELVTMIQGKPEERLKALKFFFMDQALELEVIESILTNKGANREDAQDAYQDSFAIFQRQVKSGKFKGDSSLRTFFIGICQRRWLDLKRKSFVTKVSLVDEQTIFEKPAEKSPESILEGQQRLQLLRKLLGALSPICHQIMWLKANGYRLREIMDKLDLSGNYDTLRNKSKTCMKALRERFREHPEMELLFKSLMHS